MQQFMSGLLQNLSFNPFPSIAIFQSSFEGPAWKMKWEMNQVKKICEFEKGKSLGEEVGLSWLKRRYAMGYMMSPLIDQGCFICL